MEKNSIYTIAITLFVFIVLASLYNFYLKIKKLSSTQTQIQKHIMYQQNIIEKHDAVLQNSGEQPVPLRRQEIAPPPLNEVENESRGEDVEQKTTERRSQPPNPIESLLPMLSSVMGMMSQGGGNENMMMGQHEEHIDEEEEEEEDDDDYEDDSEEEGSEISERKMEMVQEIANELKELDVKNENLATEGRIDEEVSVENA